MDEGGQRQKDIDTDTKKSRKEGREGGKINVGGGWRGGGQMDGWMRVWEGRRVPVSLEGTTGCGGQEQIPWCRARSHPQGCDLLGASLLRPGLQVGARRVCLSFHPQHPAGLPNQGVCLSLCSSLTYVWPLQEALGAGSAGTQVEALGAEGEVSV